MVRCGQNRGWQAFGWASPSPRDRNCVDGNVCMTGCSIPQGEDALPQSKATQLHHPNPYSGVELLATPRKQPKAASPQRWHKRGLPAGQRGRRCARGMAGERSARRQWARERERGGGGLHREEGWPHPGLDEWGQTKHPPPLLCISLPPSVGMQVRSFSSFPTVKIKKNKRKAGHKQVTIICDMPLSPEFHAMVAGCEHQKVGGSGTASAGLREGFGMAHSPRSERCE